MKREEVKKLSDKELLEIYKYLIEEKNSYQQEIAKLEEDKEKDNKE